MADMIACFIIGLFAGVFGLFSIFSACAVIEKRRTWRQEVDERLKALSAERDRLQIHIDRQWESITKLERASENPYGKPPHHPDSLRGE